MLVTVGGVCGGRWYMVDGTCGGVDGVGGGVYMGLIVV